MYRVLILAVLQSANVFSQRTPVLKALSDMQTNVKRHVERMKQASIKSKKTQEAVVRAKESKAKSVFPEPLQAVEHMQKVIGHALKQKESRLLQDDDGFVTGLSSCPCLGDLPPYIPQVNCSYDWSYQGKCVQTVGLESNFTMYPGDYGELCKAHKEPGSSACFDLSTNPPVELNASKQANWCLEKWCYIDPCNCDSVASPTASDYFPELLHYSYETCGSKNTYTAAVSSSNTVGNAQCIQSITSRNASGPGDGSVAPEPGKGEGMPAMMTQACWTACPGVEQFMEVMMKQPDMSDPQTAVNVMCPHEAAMVCMSENSVCQDPGEDGLSGPKMQAFSCGCSCPMLMDQAAVCVDPGETMACAQDSAACMEALRHENQEEMKAGADPGELLARKFKEACEEGPMGRGERRPPPGSMGKPGCPCIETLPIEKFSCDYEWSAEGECVKTLGLKSTWTEYPGNYGEYCRQHQEPGAEACFDLSQDPPVELPKDRKADWCDQPWCYVDPCRCHSVDDMTKSDYFPGTELVYSYDTCGGINMYTDAVESMNLVGNAECLGEGMPGMGDDMPRGDDMPPAMGKCMEKCPGLEDMMKEMAEMGNSGEEVSPEEGMMAMCPHLETQRCMMTTPECMGGHERHEEHEERGELHEKREERGEHEGHEGRDHDGREGPEHDGAEMMMGMMSCMCECPDIAKGSPCENPEGPGPLIQCITSKDQCQPLMSEFMGSLNDPSKFQEFVNVQCEYENAGCEGEEEDHRCSGEAEAAWGMGMCDDKMEDKDAMNAVPKDRALSSAADHGPKRFGMVQSSMERVLSFAKKVTEAKAAAEAKAAEEAKAEKIRRLQTNSSSNSTNSSSSTSSNTSSAPAATATTTTATASNITSSNSSAPAATTTPAPAPTSNTSNSSSAPAPASNSSAPFTTTTLAPAPAPPPARPTPIPSMGMPQCPCLGALDIPKVDCTASWGVGGKCVEAQVGTSKVSYPGDFGEMCKLHKEPGQPSCYNLTTGMELETNAQADWCLNSWCFIDPCRCDAADATKSDYFAKPAYYSYSTCGSAAEYKSVEGSMNTAGNAACLGENWDDVEDDGSAPPGGMPAILSEACAAVCPDAKDLIMGMMKAEGMSPQETMLMMCARLPTMECITENEECQDPGMEEDGMKEAALGASCMCSCPIMMDMEKVCEDPDPALNCVMEEPKCEEMRKHQMREEGLSSEADLKAWAKKDLERGDACEDFKPTPPPRGEMGMPSCPCIGRLPRWIEKFECPHEWSFGGKCVKAVGLDSPFTEYPGDYGESCAEHKEPGQEACFDISESPPTEKSDPAEWCTEPWCYIDPCNCDATDATGSDYFPGRLAYSYATCGAKNEYVGSVESSMNTVGNAECDHHREGPGMHRGRDFEPVSCCMAAEKIVECKGAKCINLQAAISLHMKADPKEMGHHDMEGDEMDMIPAYKRQFAAVKSCDGLAGKGIAGSKAELYEKAGGAPPPAPAPPPPAPSPPSPSPTPQVVIVEETFVESKIEVVQEFPPDTTSESLMQDTGYVDTLQESTAESIGVPKDDVTITKLNLQKVRRLGGSARRLQSEKMSLTVDYKVKVKDAEEAKKVQEVLEDETLREAAQKKFEEKYVEKEKERTGEEPKGLEVKQEAKVEIKTEEKEVVVEGTGDSPVADEEADLASKHFAGLAFILAAGQMTIL
eukprot:gnl/MRDRNA2_/MRDRNA2_80075_c0_seq1.p1 gnl/MRDRNA2_/MRDRNA2_80075_c0~~gnl/MRDRNA2_/MRDRNA2_80075_c0_seq1.p1  ORF type:complete len:1679 (+),score=385.09 gnl/MRDRNA2_/MRDRNA2_80075_c0_seq1:132-5168(+)